MLYSSNGWSRDLVGEYENGKIYSSNGWSKDLVGEYENGKVYSSNGWSKDLVGEYENGKVYSSNGWSKKLVGEYENGNIYRLNGWSRELVGEYSSDAVGAAAFLLLFNCNAGGSSNSTNSKESSRASAGVAIENSCEIQKETPTETPVAFKALIVIVGIALAFALSYCMYFVVSWKWASYAMFFTCLIGTVLTNILVFKDLKKGKREDINKGWKGFLSENISVMAVLLYLMSLCVYVVEAIAIEKVNFGYLMLGLIVSAVNVFVYAIPFLFLEIIILLFAYSYYSKN